MRLVLKFVLRYHLSTISKQSRTCLCLLFLLSPFCRHRTRQSEISRVALFLTVRIFYLLDFNFYRIIFSFHICYLPYRESIAGSDFLIYEYASNNLYVIKSSYLHLTQILSIQRNYIMFYAITQQMPSENIYLYSFSFLCSVRTSKRHLDRCFLLTRLIMEMSSIP